MLPSRTQTATQPLFSDWTGHRTLTNIGTNTGATPLPFQDWRTIKEAFAPELIYRAISESSLNVTHCLDPFGGSGTTGLACQFLGVHPTLAEVNPYLSDLIEAKLARYNSDTAIFREHSRVVEAAASRCPTDIATRFASAPPTLIEPGLKGRWIFDLPVAQRIVALHDAMKDLADPRHYRLFRVLLGGILEEVSNVVVRGKGRRYRTNWKERQLTADQVSVAFDTRVRRAVSDIFRFRNRATMSYDLIRGDSRASLDADLSQYELTVFSPPYPNSSDYTDVYNLELWMLEYLKDKDANRKLRSATLSSHVQIRRDFDSPVVDSPRLKIVLDSLYLEREYLWNPYIPDMIRGYFADLLRVLANVRIRLASRGMAWIIVSDSRYATVHVPVSEILQELVQQCGWTVRSAEPSRSIRTSAQQGAKPHLVEQLLVLQKP